jgi:hypothetical protein
MNNKEFPGERQLTMRVEVKVEEYPRPLKVISNQSSKFDVLFRLQKETSRAPINESPLLANVRNQYLPVRRITLRGMSI